MATFVLSLVAALAIAPAPAPRAVRVPAVDGAAAAALATAAAGDTLVLEPGVHRGPLHVERPLVLRGEKGAVVSGGGHGTVILVTGGNARVEDLEVRDSGTRVITIDSGIKVVGAAGVVVRGVRARDVLYAVYGERAAQLIVAACDLEGRVPEGVEDGSGDGIHLWHCDTPRVAGNRVRHFADAVYLAFVNHAQVLDNTLERNGRYGLHTMYCQKNRLTGNRFAYNTAGCAIMFSNHLVVRGNDFFRNRGPRTYGVLLRDCSDGSFEDNRIVDNTVGVFMDNSNRNRISGNLIEDNGWGILMFSSCAGNATFGNNFIQNDYPVALDMKYSSNRFDDGALGNYWSENAPYDLDANGTSDVPYSPVSTFAFLSKQYPDLAVLARSPAVAALGVAERVIPALRPSEAVDRYPRLQPLRIRGTGRPLSRAASPATTWPAAAAYALLALGGLGAFLAARRSA